MAILVKINVRKISARGRGHSHADLFGPRARIPRAFASLRLAVWPCGRHREGWRGKGSVASGATHKLRQGRVSRSAPVTSLTQTIETKAQGSYTRGLVRSARPLKIRSNARRVSSMSSSWCTAETYIRPSGSTYKPSAKALNTYSLNRCGSSCRVSR